MNALTPRSKRVNGVESPLGCLDVDAAFDAAQALQRHTGPRIPAGCLPPVTSLQDLQRRVAPSSPPRNTSPQTPA